MSEALLRGAANCPASARTVVASVSRLAGEPVIADLTTATSLTDHATVLARARNALDAQIGRSLLAGERADVLPHAPRTQLEREASWSGHASAALVTAARFCGRHRDVAALWEQGRLCTDVIAALARGLSGLPWEVEKKVVGAVLGELPSLTVRGVKLVVAHVLDLVRPDDRDTAEQSDYDRRRVVVTTHGGMTMIAADLPDLEGEAVMAALDAVAESLRVAGDRLTKAQRRADALITLVNRSSADGGVPATAGGLPVGVTVTMGAGEADRVATGTGRPGPAADPLPADAPGSAVAGLGTVPGRAHTLGDAAARFALCAGAVTGVVVADHECGGLGCEAGAPGLRPLTGALLATRVQPLALGRSVRLATAAQRTALAVRDGGCILCHRPPSECQTHHLREWADGGPTDLDNLVLLCWSHHRQVDLHRWEIARNPEDSPGATAWIVTPVPRHQWRRRRPDAADAA